MPWGQPNNSGASWRWRDLPIQSSGVIALQSGGGGLLLASSERGLYISRDSGAMWALAAHGLPASPPEDVAVVGSVWFAAMQYGGVYVSKNAGDTWTRAKGTFGEGLFPVMLSDTAGKSIYAASATEGVYAFRMKGISSEAKTAQRASGSGVHR